MGVLQTDGKEGGKHVRRVIRVNGYLAFRGTMKIRFEKGKPPEEIYGDWLYRPDTDKWYWKDRSFPKAVCTIVEARA